MHLCLSSGASPRYLEDVLRALATPSGADLQFRYRLRWLSPQTLTRLGKGTNERAVIGYIDQSEPDRAPVVIPCRFARIVGTVRHGTTVSITLRVEGFAYSSDLVATNVSLRGLATGVPEWTGGELKGYWWTDMSDVPDGIQDTGSLEAWESIVGQLHAHEFSRQEVFYIVTGIGQADAEMPEGDDLKTPTLCDAENGRLVLNPQSDYEIRVYHYYPNSAPTQSMHLVVESTSPLIRFSTPTKVPIDSPYDLKRFRFRTGGAVSEEFPVISVCSQHAGATATVAFGVDLLAIIRGQWQRFAWYGLSIGILIGLSPAVAAVANSALSDTQKVLITVLSLVAGIVAGEVAAFGLKKL